MAQAAAGTGGARGRAEEDRFGWKEEGQALMRGITGGAIVGMPLLYTMEMWWQGMSLSEWHLVMLLGVILLVNFFFNLVSGFRQTYSVAEALSEAVTAVGIGILFSAGVLWLIGEIGPEVALVEIAGKITLEAAVVSVGVSFANSQVLGKSRTGEENGGPPGGPPSGNGRDRSPEWRQVRADLQDAGATIAGAMVFALNIAPTEEIIMIATRLAPWQLLAMLGGGVLLCYVILFASGFEKHQVHVRSVFQHPFAETVLSTALSLGVAFVLLWLLGQREALSQPSTAVASTVTLGLPAIVGGAAGRLII